MALIAHTVKGSADTANVTTNSIDTTGAQLLIAILSKIGASGTLSDNKSNTWALAVAALGGYGHIGIAYVATPTVGTGHTFTATGSYPALAVFAYNGATITPVLDGTNSGNNGLAGPGSKTVSPGSITPTGNGRIIVAGMSSWGWVGGVNTGTISIDASMTVQDQLLVLSAGGNLGIGAADYIQPTAGAIAPTFSWPQDNMGAVAAIAAFQISAAAGGGGTPVFSTQYRRRRG